MGELKRSTNMTITLKSMCHAYTNMFVETSPPYHAYDKYGFEPDWIDTNENRIFTTFRITKTQVTIEVTTLADLLQIAKDFGGIIINTDIDSHEMIYRIYDNYAD
jgi:hypothetical protein